MPRRKTEPASLPEIGTLPFAPEVPSERQEELKHRLGYFLGELIPWMEEPRVAVIRSQMRALRDDIEDRIEMARWKKEQEEEPPFETAEGLEKP